jgi:hypothetical protein
MIDAAKLLEIMTNLTLMLRSKDPSLKRSVYYFIEHIVLIREQMDPYKPSNNIFNKGNIYPQMETIIQNVYNDIKNSDTLEAFQLRTLQNLQKTMDDSCAKYIDAFNDMYSFMIGKLVSAYDFSTIYLVFENLSSLMIIIKDNNEAMAKLVGSIFPLLNEIIKNNHVDLLGYAFQIYALAIHFFNIQDENPKTLFSSLMVLSNWNKDMIPFFPAYITFVEEFVSKDISLLGEHTETFRGILDILLENDFDDLFFSLANKIVQHADLKPLRDSGLMNTMIGAIAKCLQRSRE